jgi:hypothetical protein
MNFGSIKLTEPTNFIQFINCMYARDKLHCHPKTNSKIYFSIHILLRDLLRERRILLGGYDKEYTLSLIETYYIKDIIAEVKHKNIQKIREYNIDNNVYNILSDFNKRQTILSFVNNLSAEVRHEIASRLLGWIQNEIVRMEHEEGIAGSKLKKVDF